MQPMDLKGKRIFKVSKLGRVAWGRMRPVTLMRPSLYLPLELRGDGELGVMGTFFVGEWVFIHFKNCLKGVP